MRDTFWINPTAHFPLELRLMIACLNSGSGDRAPGQLSELTTQNVDWEAFLRWVARHRVAPVVHKKLSSAFVQNVPEHVLLSLKNRCGQNACYLMRLTVELTRILKLFENHGIRAIPLKGPVLATQLYGELSQRQMSDLDILVPTDVFGSADGLLRSIGYNPSSCCPFDFTGSRRQRMNATYHHAGYVNVGEPIKVELHWKLIRNSSLFQVDFDSLWRRTEQTDFFGYAVRTFPVDDQLLYLCVHGALHSWNRLFWLCDLAKMIIGQPDIRWESILSKARHLGASRTLVQGVILSHLLLNTELPEAIKSYAVDSKITSHLVCSALRRISMPNASLQPGWESFSSYFSYRLNLSSLSRYKVSSLKSFFSIPEDWQIIELPGPLFPVYYLLRFPFWLVRKKRAIQENP